jgi:uroporphyrinogen III methyltransferase/synthase
MGAGPGDLAYLTVAAWQLLKRAEVLVYDALVDERLLELVPAHCLTLDMGKRGGGQRTPQAEINQLLVDYCQQGKQVVRLKSGDPFIFGRCTSEIEALKQAGCAFSVIPGLSSALAAPTLTDIPLTDAAFSRCFAVCSAHEPDTLPWEALTQLETLVLLMGAKQLPEIIHQLERHGRSLSTPVAVIRWASQPDQQIWVGTLASIRQQTDRQTIAPCIIVIGEVVGLRPYIQGGRPLPDFFATLMSQSTTMSDNSELEGTLTPQAALPLQGKTILVTRSAGQSSQFTTLLEAEGATVLEMPALEIGPPSSWADLDAAIQELSTFDWLTFSSANGVEYLFQRMLAQGKDARALAGVKISVVGKKTAESLKQWGIQPDFIPPNYVADDLVATFPEGDRLDGLRILFPRVETGGREVLVKEFTARGAAVVEVPAYQSGCASGIASDVLTALQSGKVDVITFASSKTVRCFAQLGQSASPSIPLDQTMLASIGPQTSETCEQLFGRVDIEATEYTLEGLTQAIVAWATAP